MTSRSPILERAWAWPAEYWGVVAVVLAGLWIRVAGLSEYWLSPDEGIYYSALTYGSFRDFWAEVAAHAHPPLYYLVLRGAGALTWDFVTLRLLSAVSGAVAIWAMWAVGRELGGEGRAGRVSGFVTAGLVAFSAPAIVLSQVIRPYALLTALIALALLGLLRYRRTPRASLLAGYAAFSAAAMLTHFSALMAWCVCAILIVADRLSGRMRGRDFTRLLGASVVPAVVFATLLVQHLARMRQSAYASAMLGPGGWLEQQMVGSPADAWRVLAEFQVFSVPAAFAGGAAVLFVGGVVGVALVEDDRALPILAGVAIGGSLLASALGLYPFGQSRHSAWLVPFALPVFGWVAGRLLTRLRDGRAVWIVALAAVALVALAPGPWSDPSAADPAWAEEKVLRRAEVAQLVGGALAPDAEPRTVLMSQQPYYMLMPLYADARDDARRAPNSGVFSFRYGSRQIVVGEYWDWGRSEEMYGDLRSMSAAAPWAFPEAESEFVLVAGGWGSSLFFDLSELVEAGVLSRDQRIVGETPGGGRLLRIVAAVVDRAAFQEADRP